MVESKSEKKWLQFLTSNEFEYHYHNRIKNPKKYDMVEQMIERYSNVKDNTAEKIGNYAKQFIKDMKDIEEKEQQHKNNNNVSKKNKR